MYLYKCQLFTNISNQVGAPGRIALNVPAVTDVLGAGYRALQSNDPFHKCAGAKPCRGRKPEQGLRKPSRR